MTEWEKVQGKIDTLPINKKDARYFTRFFFSAAVECEFDRQGELTFQTHYVITRRSKRNVLLSAFPIVLKFGATTAGTTLRMMLKKTLMTLLKI